MDILEVANRFPPCLCRLLARKANGHLPMTVSDISRASGLSRGTVAELSFRTSWKGISIEVVSAFSAACGVNLMHPRREIDYLHRRRMVHTTHARLANGAQRKFFAKLYKVCTQG